mmetsp:Transcript_5500/g.20781  ORF Transcript_5500/g.20781 Transcript_5500/m.20781 type:complete len:273 (+) Transcript_5500:160-978(+)
MSKTVSTPCSPPQANPQTNGLPTATKSAPNAKAFTTSAPRRTPPSKMIGILFCFFLENSFVCNKSRVPSSTPCTTPGNARKVAGAPSSCLPPWLLTQTPCTPCFTASLASSFRTIPFTMIGLFVTVLIHFMKSHVNEVSRPPTRFAMEACVLVVLVVPVPVVLVVVRRLDCVSVPGSDPAPVFFLVPVTTTFSNLNSFLNANLFRTSRSRRPNTGASTVTTNAAHPHFSARFTKPSVSCLSLKMYSWNHMFGGGFRAFGDFCSYLASSPSEV